jgi:transcription-repair coupling factor (superfamily II helicase)
MRLRLYRRIASLRRMEDVEAMKAEFADRFGPLSPPVLNLLYQVKVKLLAENAGVTNVSGENKQIILRFPTLADGQAGREFPNLGSDIRTGKSTIWVPAGDPNWQERLLQILSQLSYNS